jgi:hypothetical protein
VSEREILTWAVMDIVQRDNVTADVQLRPELTVVDDCCVAVANVFVKELASDVDLLELGVFVLRRRVWDACGSLSVLDSVGIMSRVWVDVLLVLISRLSDFVSQSAERDAVVSRDAECVEDGVSSGVLVAVTSRESVTVSSGVAVDERVGTREGVLAWVSVDR